MGTRRRDGRTATRWISISRLVRGGPAESRRRARGGEEDAEMSRARTAAGCLVRIRARVGRRWRPRRRARAGGRGGEDDPEDDEEEHPREGEGEGEGEEGGEGNVQRAGARASVRRGAPDGDARPGGVRPRRPRAHPRGRLGGGRRTSGPRRGSARASSRRDARIASSASALETARGRGSPSPLPASAREAERAPSVDRGRWFHFPPALEVASRAFAGSLDSDRSSTEAAEGRLTTKKKVFFARHCMIS